MMNIYPGYTDRSLLRSLDGCASVSSAPTISRKRTWMRVCGAEAGYTIIFQATYYTLLLYMFLGLIYDFGGVGYAIVIANNAVRLAALDAVRNIDTQKYFDTQEIRLDSNAEQSARDMVSGLTAGGVEVTSVSVNHLVTRDVILVSAEVEVGFPILGSLFGMNPVTVPIQAYAEPAFGIAEEGQ